MSAKPEVIGTIGEDETVTLSARALDAIAVEMESLKRQRAGLIAKNAVLVELVNEAQLQASHAIALSKFSEAQMYQRVLALETAVTSLEAAQDRTANFLQGLADCPTRAEFDQLKSDYYSHSARSNC